MRRPIENPNEETAVTKKQMFNFKEKERIGEEAVKLINEGDVIMLDSGTTTLEIARHLDKFQNLRIITNAINIAYNQIFVAKYIFLAKKNKQDLKILWTAPIEKVNAQIFVLPVHLVFHTTREGV